LLDFILTLHSYNVYLVLAVSAISGIFGLVLYFTKRPVLRQWRIMLIVTLVLSLLQGALGLTMVAMGQKPGGGTGLYYLHYVYGAIVALGIPFVWLSFTTNVQDETKDQETAKEQAKRRDMLFYSIAMLVMMAAAVRALMTGPA